MARTKKIEQEKDAKKEITDDKKDTHSHKEHDRGHENTLEQKENTDKPEPVLTEEQKKQLDKIKSEMDTFNKRILEKFDKYILGVSLLEPKKEEPDKHNVLVLIDDSDSKKMTKQELKTKLGAIIESIGKEVSPNLAANTVILSELWESCYDGKSELLDLIFKSIIIFDRGILSAVKIGNLHKKMVLDKFEKYIVAYVLFGSLTRGEATDKSDIDVAIIIDDTDVKRMTRAELKDKLRAIIIGMGYEAGEITGIKNKLNIQVYILTDFWESIRDANPVIFTVLRDGIPFYDRGIFTPWKQLLKMGKIKPSQESIDMFMNTGEEIIKRIRDKIKNLVESDIYWATLTPSQAALMIYGLPPPTPKETIKLMEDIFVKKEKILEEEYIDILKNNRKYYKELEHGELKEIKGAQVDKLLDDSEKYLVRIKKLFDELYLLREKDAVREIRDNIITATRDLLKVQGVPEVSDDDIQKSFEKNIINTGIVPNRFNTLLKNILKSLHDKKVEKNELNELKKDATEYLKFIIETIQRIRIRNIESQRVRVIHGKKTAELIFLNKNVFIIKDLEKKDELLEASFDPEKGIKEPKESTHEKLDKEIEKLERFERPKLSKKILESIEDLFGKDFEIMF